jgi:hypothetical protein
MLETGVFTALTTLRLVLFPMELRTFARLAKVTCKRPDLQKAEK